MELNIDISLIEACRQKDRKAQKQLYDTTAEFFMRLCLRYIGDTQEACFALNEAYLKVFTQIHKYKEKGSFEGWMRRIFVNTCLDELRKKKTTADIENHESSYNQIHVEDEAGILAMIKKLKPPGGEIFNLFAIEGYSHKEISKMLNISIANSKWHLMKARQTLQKQIKQLANAI